jgi:sodium-dependent phosphate cotransporter
LPELLIFTEVMVLPPVVQSQPEEAPPQKKWRIYLRNTAYIIAALLIFLFSLDLMISALQHVGKSITDVIILATANPFTGLFIGLLVTAIIQSSSATTSMVVALVATGSISLPGAVPIIMGANVGTTITSTIVSLSFITKKKEFKRAVAAGTYHDFFNILTVVILFPLEYYFGFLSGVSQFLANFFFVQPHASSVAHRSWLDTLFNPVIEFLVKNIPNNFWTVVIAIGLLFSSILFFRKIITNILGLTSPDRFQHFFFKNTLKSFGWGLLTTAAIRSSTVTTSLVVPLVAKKIVKLKAATPFILGANIGTTITAFIASSFNSNAAISIAIAHFLFNFIGVSIFLPIPYVKEIPIKLADRLGRMTLRYRLVGFSYLLMTFFVIPFSLIFLSRNLVEVQEAIYVKSDTKNMTTFSVLLQQYESSQFSHWSATAQETNDPNIISVYRKKNILIIGNELFELNKPGFCKEGEDENGNYRQCLVQRLPSFQLNGLEAQQVFVFEKKWFDKNKNDTLALRTYVSATTNIIMKKEIKTVSTGIILYQEEIKKLVKR